MKSFKSEIFVLLIYRYLSTTIITKTKIKIYLWFSKIITNILIDSSSFSSMYSRIQVSNTKRVLLLFSDTFDELLSLSKAAVFPINSSPLKVNTPGLSQKTVVNEFPLSAFCFDLTAPNNKNNNKNV